MDSSYNILTLAVGSDRYNDYPRLQRLVKLKDELLAERATPPMCAPLFSLTFGKTSCYLAFYLRYTLLFSVLVSEPVFPGKISFNSSLLNFQVYSRGSGNISSDLSGHALRRRFAGAGWIAARFA